ncbi:MAG: hypothetical protein AB8H79_14300 [Myxococcota bacterium]
MHRPVATAALFFAGVPAWGAAPTFVADAPEDATLAVRAWAAGEACAGWTPASHDPIRLVRSHKMEGFDGRAHLDAEGLHTVELAGLNPRRSLLHEIAHAWTRKGPPALTEGRTDLLADCMATHLSEPDLLDPDDGRDLDALPDLRKWTNPRNYSGGTGLDQDRSDAYLGSARFLRVVAAVVEPTSLWPRSGQLRWKDLERALLRTGPKGAIILDTLNGGPERLRAGLTDSDRDGQPWLAEILLGTDPERWDSDGDGWWDGAPAAPLGAIPLPSDGSMVCSGVAVGPKGARVRVTYRATRVSAPPPVRVVAGDVWLVDDPAQGVWLNPEEPVLLALDGGQRDSAGGTWALPGGQHLSTAWNCSSTPRYTVWVADPSSAAALADFQAALGEHLHRANGLLGPPARRIVVALGAPGVEATDDVIYLSKGQVEWAQNHGRLDALAALAIALHRTRMAPDGHRRWDVAEALTRALVDDPPAMLFVAADEEHPAERTLDARRCRWRGVVEGRCDQRPSAPEQPAK